MELDTAIARAIGFAHDEDVTKLDYMAALAKAKDAAKATEHMRPNVSLGDRQQILALLQSGESIIDVADQLPPLDGAPYTLQTVVQVLTLGNASTLWLWLEGDWLRWEATLFDAETPERSERQWGFHFGLTRKVMRSLEEVYGRELPRSGKGVSMQAAILMLPWETSPSDVVDALRDRYPTIRISHVNTTRKRVLEGRNIRCPESVRHLMLLPKAA